MAADFGSSRAADFRAAADLMVVPFIEMKG
jgi:hypothetical protein